MALRSEFEVHCTSKTHPSTSPKSMKLDVADSEATLRLVAEIAPDVIINTAALTDVDYCELHKEEAERVNVGGARNLAEAARTNGSRFIHLSTDSVFDGTRGHYSESDIPNPINTYSKTKLESERIVSQLSNFAIARPSVVYGWHTVNPNTTGTKRLNFAMFVLDKLNNDERVKAVTDQYSSPTLADNLAEALLILGRITENGIFHTAGKSCLNRYEFAIAICRIFGYPPELVQPVLSNEFVQVAKRPKNCCLQVGKAEKALGLRFLSAQEGITQMKQEHSYGT